MTVQDLINRLSEFDPEMEVTILDGFNGGGQPRTINSGPRVWNPQMWPHCYEANDYSDIKSESGEKIVVMGYGCY